MKTIFTYVSLLFISATVTAEISSTEKSALIKLNKSTNGSQWIKKWDLKSPASTWYGVEIKNDKVVSINLVNNNLAGTLPNELGDLSSLETLNLFRNDLTGSLPSSIGKLTKLTSLSIAFNKIS
ncbi:hypothetical protein WFZ85_01375 [Flavobacterium sp. j3]|uniref:Two component regulator three Y domain protein n=1 Tax=Flavobacterium aureirubrum TaxID=3133147 RepID=A0ABU9N0J9_9FLAO